MGYSASKLKGDELVIPKERFEQFLEGLRRAEKNGLGDHISWCQPIDDYLKKWDDPADLGLAIAEILTDYGFTEPEVDDDGSMLILDWGGDKLGSSWDHVIEAIAEVTTTETAWFMHGEDDCLWAVVFDGQGDYRESDVKLST
jgi:hypothetical protein